MSKRDKNTVIGSGIGAVSGAALTGGSGIGAVGGGQLVVLSIDRLESI